MPHVEERQKRLPARRADPEGTERAERAWLVQEQQETVTCECRLCSEVKSSGERWWLEEFGARSGKLLKDFLRCLYPINKGKRREFENGNWHFYVQQICIEYLLCTRQLGSVSKQTDKNTKLWSLQLVSMVGNIKYTMKLSKL